MSVMEGREQCRAMYYLIMIELIVKRLVMEIKKNNKIILIQVPTGFFPMG